MAILTRDNAEQQKMLPQVERLATRLTRRANAVIMARRDYGADRAIELLRSGEGARALEEFRTLATELKERELSLLAARDREANASFLRTQRALAVVTLVDFCSPPLRASAPSEISAGVK